MTHSNPRPCVRPPRTLQPVAGRPAALSPSASPSDETAGRPIAIDLFCGLGGWSEGLIAEGYDVIGFDIEAHEYGEHKYPGKLVLQDVLTIHGSQFKDAALIVASPPCQEYSYMAMPWKRAKAKAAAIRADETGQKLADLNALFDACFRIQKEASIAAGRHIPMVVENVRGAIPWVGRSRWNFGSFHLWGRRAGADAVHGGGAEGARISLRRQRAEFSKRERQRPQVRRCLVRQRERPLADAPAQFQIASTQSGVRHDR